LEAGADVVGGLCPPEGFGFGVVGVDDGPDVLLQLMYGAVDASPEMLFGDEGKEALDLVDLRRAGGGEVDMPSRPLVQPVAERLGLVAGVVVHHQVNVEVAGHAGLDLVEEASELAGAVLSV
jgi:hypothetical protein